jgi:hypothetical protein
MYKIPTSTSRATSQSPTAGEGGQICKHKNKAKQRGLAYTRLDFYKITKKIDLSTRIHTAKTDNKADLVSLQ